MGTSRQTTESQLKEAKAALERRVAALKEKNIEAKAFKNDPKWRELDGYVRQIGARLRKVAEIEKNNEELTQHKTERQAQLATKKAERRDEIAGKKPKADKEAEKPKAKKGKGEGKAADAKAESKGAEKSAEGEPKAKKEKPPKKEKGGDKEKAE